MQNQIADNKLEANIFEVICALGFSLCIYGIISDLTIGGQTVTLVSDIFCTVLFSVFFYLSRFKKMYRHVIIPFLILILLIVIVYWFLLGGLYGPSALIALTTMVLFAVLVPYHFRKKALIFYGFIMLGLTIMQLHFYPIDLNETTRESIPFSFILLLVGVGFVVFFLKKRYEKDRQEIIRQNNELEDMNNEINEINASLEIMVKERTLKLEKHNKRLADYAHLNAHLLRAPASRIAGLISILKLDSNDPKQKNDIVQRLIQSSDELISITNEMSKKLNEEDQSDISGQKKIET